MSYDLEDPEELEMFNDEANELLSRLFEDIQDRYSKDELWDNAREYAEYVFEKNHHEPMWQLYTDAIDRQYDALKDATVNNAWKVLEKPRGAFSFGEKELERVRKEAGVEDDEDEDEELSEATLDEIRDLWDDYFRENAGAQMYRLTWRTNQEAAAGDSDGISVVVLGDEELFGGDGVDDRPVWFSESFSRNDIDVLDVLRTDEGREAFQPDEEVVAYMRDMNVDLEDFVESLPETSGSNEVPYLSGVYPEHEGYYEIVVDEDALETLVDEFVSHEMPRAAPSNADVWQTIIYGEELDAAQKKRLRGTPEETRIMGFELGKGGGQFDFVSLDNAAACKRQGFSLGQCVGNRQYGYIDGVEDKTHKVVTMRAMPSGKEKLTLFYSLDEDGAIDEFLEVKGKGNRLPGFGNEDGVGKFKPLEVEVLLRFARAMGAYDAMLQAEDMQPALRRLEEMGETGLQPLRQNPSRRRRRRR